MSVTVGALFIMLIFILVFQICSTVSSFRKNKVEQTDLNFTIISLIILAIIPSLDKNFILSIIDAIMIILIIVRLIFSFIYFTYFFKRNKGGIV